MNDLEPSALKQHLYSLFLCCHSIMAGAVETLERCYRFRIRLEIGGAANPGYQLFKDIIRKLGLEFEEVEIPKNLVERPWDWFRDTSTKNQRVWIPEMRHREPDYHVMLPFYLRYHLKSLRGRDPKFPIPKVDNLYVVLLWHDCFGMKQAPMSAHILNDLLLWEKHGILTVHDSGANLSTEMSGIYGKVSMISDLSQLYLGFCRGAEGLGLIRGSAMEKHSFNVFSRNKAAVSSIVIRSSPGSGLGNPFYIRQLKWDVEQIGVIAKNAWMLNTFKPPGSEEETKRVRECLTMRLRGFSEDEQREQLGFGSQESFYNWQVAHIIDIKAGRFRDPLEDWLQACRYFEIVPNAEILDKPATPEPKVPVAESGKSQKEAEVTSTKPQFRHSPDFRFVVAENGKSFALTEKQAHVISLELISKGVEINKKVA